MSFKLSIDRRIQSICMNSQQGETIYQRFVLFVQQAIRTCAAREAKQKSLKLFQTFIQNKCQTSNKRLFEFYKRLIRSMQSSSVKLFFYEVEGLLCQWLFHHFLNLNQPLFAKYFLQISYQLQPTPFKNLALAFVSSKLNEQQSALAHLNESRSKTRRLIRQKRKNREEVQDEKINLSQTYQNLSKFNIKQKNHFKQLSCRSFFQIKDKSIHIDRKIKPVSIDTHSVLNRQQFQQVLHKYCNLQQAIVHYNQMRNLVVLPERVEKVGSLILIQKDQKFQLIFKTMLNSYQVLIKLNGLTADYLIENIHSIKEIGHASLRAQFKTAIVKIYPKLVVIQKFR